MQKVRSIISHAGICLLVIIFGMGACSDGEKPVKPEQDTCADVITVTGEMVEIVDLIPVDGPVILRMKDDNDEMYEMSIGSPMMVPWTEEEGQLYHKLGELEPGNRLEATGCVLEHGIKLLDFEKLD